MSYLDPPARLPLILRLVLGIAERRLGRKLLAGRILAWYPRFLIGSGVMEGLVAHDDPEVPYRLLGLIRLRTSFLVSCPFCIDMNAKQPLANGLSDQEVRGLQGRIPLEQVPAFTAGEKAALRYVDCMCATPLAFPSSVTEELRASFSERAIVIIAGTCAQVNFWARLIQALGVPPAGFSWECSILDLESFATRGKPPGSSLDFSAMSG